MAKIYSLILGTLLFFCTPFISHAASLSTQPSTNTYEVGERIVLNVVVNSSVAFNATLGTISIPPAYFAIDSVSKASSVLNFWVSEPSISRDSGLVRFEGVALGGFEGTSGTVLTIVLHPIKVGTGKITIQGGQILANDGDGTDITGAMNGSIFTLIEAKEKPKASVTPTPSAVPTQTPAPVTPTSTFEAPELSYGIKFTAPSIFGTSYSPNTDVILSFVSEDGVKIFITGMTDADGNFVLPVPHSLKMGTYIVSGILVKDRGATRSAVSKEISIQYGSIISDLTWQIWAIMAVLVIMIIWFVIRSTLHIHMLHKVRIQSRAQAVAEKHASKKPPRRLTVDSL